MASLPHLRFATFSLIAAAVSLFAPRVSAAPFTTTATDDDVQGMSRSRLARIAPAMQAQIKEDLFAGSISLVARHGEVVHFETHGFLDEAKSKPMRKDALFRLASMTKPIVTVAAMMLVEQGRLSLNDPVSKWLPELKDLKVDSPTGDVALTQPMLVHDLMRHTAGFTYSDRTTSPRLKRLYQDANIEAREDIVGDEMLKRLGKIPLLHQPGTFWEYSITVDVLGLLIERVAHQPLDVLLKESLFDSLGMKSTVWWVSPDDVPRLAGAPVTPRLQQNPSGRTYFKGGGGLLGTADDYLKFAQMMVNGGTLDGKRYLSKKSVEFMFSQHTVGMGGTTMATTGPGYGFGLGFGVRLDDGMAWVPGSKGDAMWAGAAGTSFWIDPREGLVGILMTYGPTTRVQSRMTFKNLVYGAMVK
jgi:CubicO group peptidase (beta-lactamase class C family)